MLVKRKGIITTSLFRLTISKSSPEEIRGVLYQFSLTADGWDPFLRRAKKSAQVEFPENAVSQAYENREYNYRKVQYKEKKQKEITKKKFCELRGNKFHSSDECFTILKFKKLVWTKNNNNRKVFENVNELSLEESSGETRE